MKNDIYCKDQNDKMILPVGDTSPKNDTDNHLIKTFFRTIFSILILIVVVYLAKRFLTDELVSIGRIFIEKFGLTGLFFDVYFVDTFIVPASPDLFLALLIADGRNQLSGLILICIASVLGGISGYWIGFKLDNWKIIQRFVKKYQKQGKFMFHRYGASAVIIAALTPLPFSTICWLAGMFQMEFKKFLIATMFRIPRMILYYYIIAGVWKFS